MQIRGERSGRAGDGAGATQARVVGTAGQAWARGGRDLGVQPRVGVAL